MQIAQFLFGASYAAIHLFVKYDIPIATAYSIFHPISSAAAKASATASSVVSAVPAETYGAILRRILLRAAGDEGVAENVRDKQGNIIMEQAKEAIQKYHEETRYRTDYTTINCLDTTGQSFAVWLNILYLFPLTVLFVRFFVRAYVFRSGSSKSRSKRHSASRATKEAAQVTNREIEHAGKAVEKKLSHLPEDFAAAEKRLEKKLGHLPEDFKTTEKKLEKKKALEAKGMDVAVWNRFQDALKMNDEATIEELQELYKGFNIEDGASSDAPAMPQTVEGASAEPKDKKRVLPEKIAEVGEYCRGT